MERRIKITAYISVVIIAIVVLMVVGAVLAVFFHANPDFLHDMMMMSGHDGSHDEVRDNLSGQPVEIK